MTGKGGRHAPTRHQSPKERPGVPVGVIQGLAKSLRAGFMVRTMKG